MKAVRSTAITTDRPKIAKESCYNSQESFEACNHDSWRHAESWHEIVDHMQNALWVADVDGDPVEKIISFVERGREGDTETASGKVSLLGHPGEYEYSAYQILIEDVNVVQPATDDEVGDALASILDAFKSNRLT